MNNEDEDISTTGRGCACFAIGTICMILIIALIKFV